jgi:heme-degrading monooxygenase HmoA
MFMEVAEILIKAGAEAQFETAVQKSAHLFQRAKGCTAMRLERSVEQPSSYLLLVQWDTIENHMVDFRESDDFAQWRELVGEYFAAPPKVGHTATVVAGF